MNHQMLMASLILLPVVFGIILYILPVKIGKSVLLGIQAVLLGLAVFLFTQTQDNTQIYTILGGNHPILNIVLVGTRFSMLMVATVNLLFGIGFIYKITDQFFDGKIMLLYLILQGLTTGIFLTDDFFNLFIMFEVSTVIITLLLMFKKQGRVVYDALYYLITQMVAMMFFLFGIGFLYRTFGVLSISTIAELIPLVPAQELVLPFAFLMVGLCFKLAVFPMHSWVSRAYTLNSAPISHIAIMSSVLMKASLFWLFRLNDIFYPALDFSLFFVGFGLLTSIFGAWEAILQKDIRLVLAYSTVSQLGFMITTAFLGDGTSAIGTSYHMFNHAFFKMLLFLALGLIIRNYKTADIYEIRGKLKGNPLAAVVSIIGMLAITGFPLTSGSISKYFMSSGLELWWQQIIFYLMSFATILVFVRYSTMFLPNEMDIFKVKTVKKLSISVLALVVIIGGISATTGLNFIMQTQLSMDWWAFAEKGLIYVAMVTIAVFIYKKFMYNKMHWDARLEHSLSFSRMCLVILVFFTTLIVYGMWGVS